MKKTIIAVVLAVVLIASGLGGFVYAQNNSHEPMTGQKLVGFGRLGLQPDGMWLSMSYFNFTNPDCVSEITIEQISLIRRDGTVIYEGPLLRLVRDDDGQVVEEIPITESMKPHQIRGIGGLSGFMKDPEASNPDRWLTVEEARNLRHNLYTLEIFWSWSDKEGLPLIGWASETKRAADPALQGLGLDESELWKLETSHSRIPMVNMEQKLTPKK